MSCPGKTYEEKKMNTRKENEMTLLLTAYCATLPIRLLSGRAWVSIIPVFTES